MLCSIYTRVAISSLGNGHLEFVPATNGVQGKNGDLNIPTELDYRVKTTPILYNFKFSRLEVIKKNNEQRVS
jgi:hypothetical protein